MSLGLRKNRPLSKNAFVRGREGIGNLGCPTITIGDNQESGIVFIDEGGGLLALINGGEPVYTIGTITGTVPSGI